MWKLFGKDDDGLLAQSMNQYRSNIAVPADVESKGLDDKGCWLEVAPDPHLNFN